MRGDMERDKGYGFGIRDSAIGVGKKKGEGRMI